MSNIRYILKTGKVASFIAESIERDVNGLTRNQGFTAVDLVAYKLVVKAVILELDPDDLENPVPSADEPSLTLYGAVSVDANGQVKGYEGDGKANTTRMTCLSDKGRDFMRWSDFVALLNALNVNTEVLGKAQPKDGALRPVYFRVKALEGRGSFAARNVATAWAPDCKKFNEEDAASVSLLSAGMAAPAVPSGIPGMGGSASLSAKAADVAEHIAPPKATLAKKAGKKADEGKAGDPK